MKKSEILRIGRKFQNSDETHGCTYETAKLLCDEIERLAKKCESIEESQGNIAELREALGYVQEMLYVDCNGEVHICANEVKRISEKIKDALAASARNCDVGTAQEHTDRFKDLCRKYRRGPGSRTSCKGCPIQHESLHVGCTFAWAQLPYEREVAK